VLTARICSKLCAVQCLIAFVIFICVVLLNRLQRRRLMLCCGMGIHLRGNGDGHAMSRHTNQRRARDAVEMLARIATAVTTYLCADETFDRPAPSRLVSNTWDHRDVAKGQRRRRDPFFLIVALGGLARPPVSIIIRPVRRQNVVPTHWVRK
jgi:hypothetical protein